MFAAIAIVLTRKDPRTKFWAAVAVIAFALALGSYWPFKLYGIVYLVPVLRLFRVPARHMMEVNLALAVLAGRGLTAFSKLPDREQRTRLAIVVGLSVFLITCLIVTLGRPSSFQLVSKAPVTLLRAPELFLPIAIAGFSAWFLWRYARSQSAVRLILILALIATDVFLWGQASGWRVASPDPSSPIWREPPPQALLKNVTRDETAPYRILTAPHPFDPSREVVGPMTSPSPWVLWLQPNLYMMWGVENASGYDGFGLARYSRLAGDMTIWGELKNTDETLRGASRELDLLNVRYVFAMSSPPASEPTPVETKPADSKAEPEQASPTSPSTVSADRFAAQDLKLSSIGKGSSITFDIPPVLADRITLATSLSWSTDLPDGTPVAVMTLHAADSRRQSFEIRVGEHTSEWAYDRPDIKNRIKNSRARIATSYRVRDEQGVFQGHTYLSEFKLPEGFVITRGQIKVLESETAPDLTMTVHSVSTADKDSSFALRREWFSRRVATAQRAVDPFDRWTRVGEGELVTIFENRRALPRAWLASSYHVLKDDEILRVIRSGNLPNGSVWDPRHTALLETEVEFNRDVLEDTSAEVTVTQNRPNQIEVRTSSTSPSILVLSENFYPGWHAYVDGNSAEILRVNFNQRGLVLGQGQHIVEFVYRPNSFFVGLAISLLTVAALVLWSWRPSLLRVLISKKSLPRPSTD